MHRLTERTVLIVITAGICATTGCNYANKRGPTVIGPKDSPIEVSGGSLHICSKTNANPNISTVFTPHGANQWTVPIDSPAEYGGTGLNVGSSKPLYPTVGTWTTHMWTTDGSSAPVDSVDVSANGTQTLTVTLNSGNTLSGSLSNAHLLTFASSACNGTESCVKVDHVTVSTTNVPWTCSTVTSPGNNKCGIYMGSASQSGGSFACGWMAAKTD